MIGVKKTIGWAVCLVVFLMGTLPAVAGEEGAPSLCPPVDPAMDDIEVSVVLKEGAFRASITRSVQEREGECQPFTNPDGSAGWAEGIKISVTDDDGDIPGALNTVDGLYFWQVSADSDRVPVNEKKPRASFEFTQIDEEDTEGLETYWGEPYVVDLEVSAEDTSPLNVSELTRDLQLLENDYWDGEWLEGELCMMPRLGVSWEVDPETTGYMFTLEGVDATPEGQNNLKGLYVVETGYISRDFKETAAQYCMTLQFNQSFTGNALVLTEPICATHEEFEALLESGQRFCVELPEEPGEETGGEENGNSEEDSEDTNEGSDATDDSSDDMNEEASQASDDSEGGCQQGQQGSIPAVLLLLGLGLLMSRRNTVC